MSNQSHLEGSGVGGGERGDCVKTMQLVFKEIPYTSKF